MAGVMYEPQQENILPQMLSLAMSMKGMEQDRALSEKRVELLAKQIATAELEHKLGLMKLDLLEQTKGYELKSAELQPKLTEQQIATSKAGEEATRSGTKIAESNQAWEESLRPLREGGIKAALDQTKAQTESIKKATELAGAQFEQTKSQQAFEKRQAIDGLISRMGSAGVEVARNVYGTDPDVGPLLAQMSTDSVGPRSMEELFVQTITKAQQAGDVGPLETAFGSQFPDRSKSEWDMSTGMPTKVSQDFKFSEATKQLLQKSTKSGKAEEKKVDVGFGNTPEEVAAAQARQPFGTVDDAWKRLEDHLAARKGAGAKPDKTAGEGLKVMLAMPGGAELPDESQAERALVQKAPIDPASGFYVAGNGTLKKREKTLRNLTDVQAKAFELASRPDETATVAEHTRFLALLSQIAKSFKGKTPQEQKAAVEKVVRSFDERFGSEALSPREQGELLGLYKTLWPQQTQMQQP